MGQVIKKFSDGSFLEYDRGSFDEYCVYLTKTDGARRPPRDTDYFAILKNYAAKYGVDRIYNDYVKIYDLTGKTIDNAVFDRISTITKTYGKEDGPELEVAFCILYMAMVAEEKKAHTKLGKRIKRLGIYTLLKEDKDVDTSANFMRRMGWQSIDELCRERGF